jgi:outer membrane receptor protein involved in Fe transport
MSVNKFITYLTIVFLSFPFCLRANENLNSDDSSNQTYPISEVSSSTSEKDSPKTDESLYVLDDFVVSAENDVGYYSANSISATRTNALVKNTPITLTVVNEELLKELNIFNDEDLANVVSSVTKDPDGFSFNQLRIRGFRSLTQRYDLFWREIERDSYNIQRVDIIKGANSLMYGQADPGGLINSIPKFAQHNKDFQKFKGTLGNKSFNRKELDINHVVNDSLAFRFMGLDSSRNLDQLYENVDLSGFTLESSYRPSVDSQLRAHIEYIDLDQNLAPNVFFSSNNDKRFAANSPQDNLGGGANSFSLGTYRNEFIYNPDAIDLLPDAIINDLRLNQAYANSYHGGETTVNRDILKSIYAPWASKDNLFSVNGPDQYNKREGLITTVDFTKQLTDAVQFKVAYNRESADRNSMARDGYSNKIVKSDDSYNNEYEKDTFEPYVETYWRKQSGKTEANALKTTLLYDFELDNEWLFLKDSKHKLLIGFDYDRLEKDPKMWEQVKEGTTRDGGYFRGNDLYKERFYLEDGFGPDAPRIGYNGNDSLFELRQDNDLKVDTQSAWFANQSEFLDGRFRTLVGLRYDKIDTQFTISDYKFAVNDNYVINNLDGDYSKAVTQIENAKATFSEVSPTIGALYWLNSNFGVYANYAESIQSPSGIDVNPLGEIIPPVYGEGIEYGLRFDLLDKTLVGQVAAFYIEKENDNIVNYDYRLNDIYTYDEYFADYPQIFNPANNRLNYNTLPGKRNAGDKSRAEGVEVECYYNPNRTLSFIFSYTYNNLDALEIHPSVNPRFAQVWGQAPHNALIIGRYKFNKGSFKGLTIGANQSFRSKSSIGEWYIEADGDASGQGTWHEVEFDPEFVTSAFVSYQKRLSNLKNAPQLILNFRVNNLFNDTDLINRNKGAFYRPSRQYLLSANINF